MRDDVDDEELDRMLESEDEEEQRLAGRLAFVRRVRRAEDRELSDSEIELMIESDLEDLVQRGHALKRDRLIRKKVELDMGAESAAITGLVGAFLFGVGGITGWWLIPTAIGAIMFLGFAFSVPKRVVFKTFLFGLPALLIFGIGMLNKVQRLMNLF